MTEVKFNIIKPNLYTVGDSLFFGIEHSDLIPVSRLIYEIIKKNISELKVPGSFLKCAESGKPQQMEKYYNTPLKDYLNILDTKNGYYLITNQEREFFGLSLIIDSQTLDDLSDVIKWREIQGCLADPDAAFDAYEKNNPFCRLDREKTLGLMKKLNEELDPKIPDNYAELVVTHGYLPIPKVKKIDYIFGAVKLLQLKDKNKEKIEESQKEIVDRLKEVKGPTLSLEAKSIYFQMVNLYNNSASLFQEYGDILDENWRTKFFKLDP